MLRPNTFSDICWEVEFQELFERIKCVDYTKITDRMRRYKKKPFYNYELTYSVNEYSNTNFVRSILDTGFNVAMVFSTKYIPSHHLIGELPLEVKIGSKYYKVVDGDTHDVRLRRVDGRGVVVGLRFKGSVLRKKFALKSGFLQC